MADNKEKKKGGVGAWLSGVKTELKKVVWPSKKDVVAYTGTVIVVCAIFALCFWIIDTGVLAGLRAVLGVTLN